MYKLSKLAAGSVIVATAALGSAGIALADGYAPKGKVVYERPSDWSGVYFGVGSGYQWSSLDGAAPGPGVAGPAGTKQAAAGIGLYSIDQDSGFVSAHIGIQHQFGQAVLGVEGNWLSTIRDDPGQTLCPNAAVNCTGRLNDILTAGARLGWAMGHWMPYATGGYASARFEQTTEVIATHVILDTSSARHSGWYLGGGFEWLVSPGWTAGVEYRHYEFDDAFHVAHTALGAAVPGSHSFIDPSTDTITARVSWKFGRPEVRPLK